MIKENYPEGLSNEFLDLIDPVIQLKSKTAQIYQYKYLVVLIREVYERNKLASEGNEIQKTNNGEMISFKQLDSDDEK